MPRLADDAFAVALPEVRPSQLYLDGTKLALVARWFDFDEPNYDPLPVRRIEGRWTLTDGHTRAFAAHLAGAERLRVARDADDLEMAVYRQCVEWCEDESVTGIGDLAGRVVSGDAFEERWVERCRAVTEGRVAIPRPGTPPRRPTRRRGSRPRLRVRPGRPRPRDRRLRPSWRRDSGASRRTPRELRASALGSRR